MGEKLGFFFFSFSLLSSSLSSSVLFPVKTKSCIAKGRETKQLHSGRKGGKGGVGNLFFLFHETRLRLCSAERVVTGFSLDPPLLRTEDKTKIWLALNFVNVQIGKNKDKKTT